MKENMMSQQIERKEFPNIHVEALSIGKNKSNPWLNEDRFVITSHTFAVIDGSASRTGVKFEGKSSAQFAADVVKDVLETTTSEINGTELISVMTARLNVEIDRLGMRGVINQTPEARPAALFVAARIVDERLIVTALGDVRCRVNGQIVHTDSFISEDMMTDKRITAMKRARKENEARTDDELITIGRVSITQDLIDQVRGNFNNPDSPTGLGIIDGNDVPEKFIHVYEFDLKNVDTIELFSDGYYVEPEQADIAAWEQAFFAAEKEDPLRWGKYPSVKFATPDQFSDDRTVLIVKIK